LTAVASSEQRLAAATPRPALFDRALPLVPLLAAYLLCVSFLGWHASGHASPWLFSDELEYAQLSRSIAETGEPTRRGSPAADASVATYLQAPIWRLVDDTERAYELVKYLGVLLMAAAIFPAYALARLLVPRTYALFAAVASASIPAMAYSRLVITEPVAYPFITLTLFLLVKAFATKRLAWAVAALIALVAAEEVRQQFEIMRPVGLGALAVWLWLSDPARRFRARLPRAQWALWAACVLGLGAVAHWYAKRKEPLYYLATTLPDRAHDFVVSATGALVIGIGILPGILGLAALWRPSDLARPAYRAFVAVFVSMVALFTLYTTLKGVYISTVFANVINERNLIYLSPLFFVGTALWLHRPMLSPLVLTGATGLVLYLVVNSTYQLDYFPYSDAPGLAVLAEGNRTLSLNHAETERILVWIAVGTLVLAAALALVSPRRRRAVGAVAGVIAVLVVAWELVGLHTFGNGINRLASRIRTTVPEPPTWVDRATGGEPTIFLGQGTADPNSILATEFWNRSIEHVGSVDGSAPGPGPAPVLVPYDTTGALANDPHVRYVLTDSAGLDIRGRLVERTGLWRLIDVGGKIHLRSAWSGVFPDGWMGAAASYSAFGPSRSGELDVLTSRVGWSGPDRPAKVTIRVGELVTATYSTIANPCLNRDPCLSIQPRIGKVTATREWTVHSGRSRLFKFPVTAPFRVEVTVDPTFSPYEFGIGDNRQLGVQVAFAFKPSP
jgi:hypothetical protein